MADAVTETIVLAVMDEVVMNLMPIAFRQVDAGVAKAGNSAVVNFK